MMSRLVLNLRQGASLIQDGFGTTVAPESDIRFNHHGRPRKPVGGSTIGDATNRTSDRSGSSVYELSTITVPPLGYDENGTTVSSTLARPQGQISSGSMSAVVV